VGAVHQDEHGLYSSDNDASFTTDKAHTTMNKTTSNTKRYKYRLILHGAVQKVGLIKAKDDVEFMKIIAERYKVETFQVLAKNYYRVTIPEFAMVANQQVRTHVNRCHLVCEEI
jgi:hypothetical protein